MKAAVKEDAVYYDTADVITVTPNDLNTKTTKNVAYNVFTKGASH